MDTQAILQQGSLDATWKEILGNIKLNIPTSNFDTWFSGVNISKLDGDILVIDVPNEFVKDWIQQKYYQLILKTTQEKISDIRSIKIAVSRINKSYKKTYNKGGGQDGSLENKIPFDSFNVDPETKLNSKYGFDNFIVAPYNELATAAANAVINRLGSEYNPYFIYGGPGTGKTHLIQAIGNRVVSLYPQLKVYYLTSEEFVINYQKAVQTYSAPEFKERYRKYDLLIIDDVQFFNETRAKSMEEVFHLFCALYDRNRQIILSSDKQPNELPGLEDRLKSRFSSGMLLDLPNLDIESKFIIIEGKSKQIGVSINQDIIKYIAETIDGGVREVEGILKTLKLHTDAYNKSLDLMTVKNILQKSVRLKVINYKDVIKKTCIFFEVDNNLIFEKTRKKEVVTARQVIMFILREYLDMPFSSIGSKIGGKDHTTVIHSCEKIKREMENDILLKDKVESVKRALGV